MKRLALLLVLVLWSQSQSATLADLIVDLRLRANETDSIQSNFTNPEAIIFINDAQSRIVTLGGLLEKAFDTSYQRGDSLGVRLPLDYRRVLDVKIYIMRQWETVKFNPGFAADVDDYCFDIDWIDQDSAMILVRAKLANNTRFRVSYFGVATALVDRTDVTTVRSDLIPFIVEEAYSYYLEALRQFGAAAQVQQRIRIDLGLNRQREDVP